MEICDLVREFLVTHGFVVSSLITIITPRTRIFTIYGAGTKIGRIEIVNHHITFAYKNGRRAQTFDIHHPTSLTDLVEAIRRVLKSIQHLV